MSHEQLPSLKNGHYSIDHGHMHAHTYACIHYTFSERIGLVRAARHVPDLLQRLRVGLLGANARVNLRAGDTMINMMNIHYLHEVSMQCNILSVESPAQQETKTAV